MLSARDHNALVRRIRVWTGFVAHLDHRLGDLLHADRATLAVLAGLPGDVLVEAPDRDVAADLLVLLDHLNLHAGTRLSVARLDPVRYRVRGYRPDGGAGGERAALRLTAELRAGRPVGYRSWPGRIERIAVITRDRPATCTTTAGSRSGARSGPRSRRGRSTKDSPW